jgi:isoaspartyl peptidase/L-asparaginase-like protein (Ntn-hydrolase superfamily)
MEQHTDHVMLVSDGVIQLAKLFDIEIKYRRPSKRNLKKYSGYIKDNNYNKRMIEKEWPKNHKLVFSSLPKFNHEHYGTVGAVAIDKEGNVASAVSTGGRWFKMPGRIGDSAIIGSGIYSDNESGAACATGVGEVITRPCLAKKVCDHTKEEQQQDAMKSSKRATELLTKKFGKNTGGIITVDKYVQFGMETNTRWMPIALFTNKTNNNNNNNNNHKVTLRKDEACSLFI